MKVHFFHDIMANNFNKTLNNPINKIKRNFNVFKWSSDLNGIDDNINKQEKIIREAQNLINIATRKKNQFKEEKLILLNEGKLLQDIANNTLIEVINSNDATLVMTPTSSQYKIDFVEEAINEDKTT